MEKEPFQILTEFYHQQEYSKIINYCNEVLQIDSSNYLFFGARGKAYYELNEFNKAIADLSKAIELSPDYSIGLCNRSLCYSEIGKNLLAITDLEKAHSLNSHETHYDLLGLYYYNIENFKKAIENYTRFLKYNIDHEVLKWRADAFLQINNYKSANDDYETILLLEANSESFLQTEQINFIETETCVTNFTRIGTFNTDFTEIGFKVFEDEELRGIYIIEFLNNEYYVGQAKNAKLRLKQHFKSFSDIKKVYFKSVFKGELLNEETHAIALLEKNLFRIRNLKQISFKNIFDFKYQQNWVDDLNFNYLSGSKFNNQTIRDKTMDRFVALLNQPYHLNLISILRSYIASGIPNYLASEYNYWNLTCLPKYLKKENCISRININSIPVLSIFAKEDMSLSMMFFISKLPFYRYLKNSGSFASLFDNLPSLIFELRDAFEETDGDEITLIIQETDFEYLIKNDVIMSAIRLFNLRMMNKVGKEEKHRRVSSHCLALTDRLLTSPNSELIANLSTR